MSTHATSPPPADRSPADVDALGLFLPWVADWFREEVGRPTPPQEQAWPAIARGEHTLIHAPTGSGKTFAAFLWALNDLFRAAPGAGPAADTGRRSRGKRAAPAGVRVLYVSPLKALNNDIERNLQAPLAGIGGFAGDHAVAVPEVRSAVRTGDTPAAARASMARRPPDILITTPESLYLLLTSPVARNILRTARTLILDEIHTLSGSKRGAHLSLSLERLERLAPGFQRIGLSATQRPLGEVAGFLGGQEAGPGGEWAPRPVTVVDADYPKGLRLRVLGMQGAPGGFSGSVWPGIIPQVLEDVQRHDTTLIFANSRRQAERTADRLNAQLQLAMEEAGIDTGAEREPISPHSSSVFASGALEGPFRAHHGSMAEDARREMEQELKDGLLPALIGTSSLELGIDIGSVDMVVQLQSPKSVTTGLQRVGRSGHMVGETSEGKIYATHNEDLLECAVIARGMAARHVEEARTPQNALDVLAQQIVAAVSMDEYAVDDLYRLARGSHAYRALDRASFENVLRLVSGKYPRHLFRGLRARIHWDETNGMLRALPGSRLQALRNAGTIVDRGSFPVYLGDRQTRIGDLDEEFVYETRAGDAFLLGSQVWRASEVLDDRVIVEAAPGALPRMPFWRGEFPWRPYGLSVELARFRAELAERIRPHLHTAEDPPSVVRWLREEYLLDDTGARQAIGYVRRQLEAAGAISSDRTIIVETFQDPLGDRRLVVHSPFGGRVNAPWAIALAGALAERTGVEPEMQVGDDGILLRFPEADAPLPLDVVSEMTAAEARERVLATLPDSALFGALFRQNAARALLLPGMAGRRRTPFYLQRLRAKDLLAVARRFDDFPIVLETYRDCLEDAMDLPALERVVDGIAAGDIQVATMHSHAPSPVAQALSYGFTQFYMYEWDAPKAERGSQALRLDRAALADLFRDPAFAGTLRPEAVEEVTGEAARTAPGWRARSADELAQMLEELGDLTLEEVSARCEGDAEGWLRELAGAGRARALAVEGPDGAEDRWVATPLAPQYEKVCSGAGDRGALRSVLRSLLARGGPLSLPAIQRRYPGAADDIAAVLAELEEQSEAVSGYFTPESGRSGHAEWADERNLARIQARTLAIMRAEIEPASPLRYLRETMRLHGVGTGRGALTDALERLRGLALPPGELASEVLPARVERFSPPELDELFKAGDFVWVVRPTREGAGPRVRLLPRSSGRLYLPDEELAALQTDAIDGLPDHTRRVMGFLRSEGIASTADLRAAMGDLTLTALRDALRDLVFRGLVTADSWTALAGLLAEVSLPEAPASGGRLGGIRGLPARQAGRRRRRGSDARRAAARRVRQVSALLPPDVRWSLTTRYAVLGPEVGAAERARARATALLERYAVVSRQAIDLEGGDWAWGPIVSALSLLELRGAARRGYFVAGLPGIQFALPATVEALREERRVDDAQPVVLPARDPAYVLDRDLAGQLGRDEARLLGFTRRQSTCLVLSRGQPVLLAEENGARLTAASTAPDDAVAAAVAAFRDHRMASAGMRGRVHVTTWNSKPVAGGPGEAVLAAAGFRRDYPGMTYDAVQARGGRG